MIKNRPYSQLQYFAAKTELQAHTDFTSAIAKWFECPYAIKMLEGPIYQMHFHLTIWD
jgi:hypothetical protein